MATVVEELVAILGLDVDKSSFNRGENALSDIASLWTKIAGVAAAAGSVISGAINQNTAQIENMAKSLGVSGEFLEAFGDNVKAIGFDFENVADLIEEMNNKLGESKGLEQITPVKEALKILNLNFKELQKLAPEEQFRAIGNAALKLKDQQKAVSAVDILLGGEANKIFGYMRSTGKSFDELIDKQIAMNFQTAESRKGAVEMTKALAKLTRLFTSFAKLVAGMAGKYLAPLINKFVDVASSMVQIVKTNIDKYIDKITAALQILLSTFALFISYQIVTTIIGIAKSFNLVKLAAMAANAQVLLIPLLIGAAIALFVALAQDIYTYFASGGKADTALGRIIDWLMQFDMVRTIAGYFTALGGTITAVFNKSRNTLADFFMWIDETSSTISNNIESFFNSIADVITSIFNSSKSMLDGFFAWIDKKLNAVFGVIDTIKGVFGFDVNVNNSASNDNKKQVNITSIQNNISQNDLPPIQGTSGAIVTNNIQIDATGMDKDELNAAIDERTGQLNAIAARNNSSGMVY